MTTGKLLRLAAKAALLVGFIAIRLGEWDVSFLWSHLKQKYHSAAQYYMDTISTFVIFFLVLDFIQYFVSGIYRRRNKVRGDDNFTIGINHIYSILLVIGAAGGILSLFKLEVREVFTSLSIIFAGLAILTKDYISNMIDGMIITFSGQMSIGDNVRIGDHRGKIIDITLQNIHLLNDDDDVIYIPNNLVLTTEAINYTKREIKRTSIDFDIDLRHMKTVEELEKILIENLEPYHDQIQPNTCYLRVAEVRKDALSLKFQFILKMPNKEMERQIRRKSIRRIVQVISEREKIVDQLPEIDYPSL
jgi:small-conductance mechanosensitive channel